MNKKYVITILLILLGGLVAYAVFYVYSNMYKDRVVEPHMYDCADFTSEALRVRCEEVTYYTLQKEINKQAVDANDYAACFKHIEDGLRSTCLMSVAISHDNEEACRQFANEDKVEQCLAQLIPKADNFSDCGRLKSMAALESCRKSVVAQNDGSRQYCESLSGEADRDVCFEIHITREAVRYGEYKTCDEIAAPDGRARCLSALPPDDDHDQLSSYNETSIYYSNPNNSDTDGDGLNDYDEIKIYKTNPRRSDTDDDGFSDGDEVKNGYNPKGEGRL